MVELVAAAVAALLLANCESCEVGYASRYDAGVMEATVAARQTWGHLPEDLSGYEGAVAVLECEHIGRELEVLIGVSWHTVIVADCAVRDDSDGTRSWMKDNDILVELDYGLAARYGFTGYGALPVVVRWGAEHDE